MKIVLSTHFDIARPVKSIKLSRFKFNGLIDNFAGIFVSYEVNRRLGVPVYLTNFEERGYEGAVSVAKSLREDDTLVIVVDTIKKTDVSKGRIVSIGNVYNIDPKSLIKKIGNKIHFFDGYFEPKEDETWIYGQKFGFKTFYFGIPIASTYHDTHNSITWKKIDSVADLLVKIIKQLKTTS